MSLGGLNGTVFNISSDTSRQCRVPALQPVLVGRGEQMPSQSEPVTETQRPEAEVVQVLNCRMEGEKRPLGIKTMKGEHP